jgi:hypothetical protein
MDDQPTTGIPPAKSVCWWRRRLVTTKVAAGGVDPPVPKSQVIPLANPTFRRRGGRAWATLWMGLRAGHFKNTNFARVAGSVGHSEVDGGRKERFPLARRG